MASKAKAYTDIGGIRSWARREGRELAWDADRAKATSFADTAEALDWLASVGNAFPVTCIEE